MTLRWPSPGSRIKFNDDGKVREGVVNGEPENLDQEHPHMTTHLPVWIEDEDKRIMVYAKDIITW